MSLVMRDPTSTPTPTPDSWLDDESLYGPPSQAIGADETTVILDRIDPRAVTDLPDAAPVVVAPAAAAPLIRPRLRNELVSAAAAGVVGAVVLQIVLTPFLQKMKMEGLVPAHIAANLFLGVGLAIARSGEGGRAARVVGWAMAIGSPFVGVMTFAGALMFVHETSSFASWQSDLIRNVLHVPRWVVGLAVIALIRVPFWEWCARKVEPELGDNGYTLLAVACAGTGFWFLVVPPILAEPAIFAVTRNFILGLLPED